VSKDECHIQPRALFPDGANSLPYAPHVSHFVDSEVGRLGTVLLHRPDRELARLTPRNNDSLLFDGIPWVGRAQEEHDAFAAALRSRGVEVLYLAELLAETLGVPEARAELMDGVLANARMGDTLRRRVADHLAYLDPATLAGVLIGGLAHEELRTSWERPGGLVYTLMDRHDFIIDPLPNLLFTRDSSVWVRDRAVVTSLAMPARRRETGLTNAIYRHHPRFAGTEFVYEPALEPVEGGDVLLLAPGVIAVGVGERTTPAGAERLARRTWRTC
jgi:arginine deiminase